MPSVPRSVDRIVATYQRCKKYRALPFPGSVLEQPEDLMDLFDHIETVVAEFRQKADDDVDGEKQKQEMLKKLKLNG